MSLKASESAPVSPRFSFEMSDSDAICEGSKVKANSGIVSDLLAFDALAIDSGLPGWGTKLVSGGGIVVEASGDEDELSDCFLFTVIALGVSVTSGLVVHEGLDTEGLAGMENASRLRDFLLVTTVVFPSIMSCIIVPFINKSMLHLLREFAPLEPLSPPLVEPLPLPSPLPLPVLGMFTKHGVGINQLLGDTTKA